jgi:hypothetical protein
MASRRFALEYYRTPDGDEPVRRWMFEKLDAHKRRALVMALKLILCEHGIEACGTESGRHLGHGSFESRLRHDEGARGRPVRRNLRQAVPAVLRGVSSSHYTSAYAAKSTIIATISKVSITARQSRAGERTSSVRYRYRCSIAAWKRYTE